MVRLEVTKRGSRIPAIALSCLCAAILVCTLALAAAGPVSAAPSPAMDVAQAALDQVCETLIQAWPDTPSVAVPFDESAIRAVFDPVLVPDPVAGLEPFASARVMDNVSRLDQAVTWDSNLDGRLVVEYRGASGADVCSMRVLVQCARYVIDLGPAPGVALFAGGDLLSGGNRPKIQVELSTGANVAVHAVGAIEDPTVATADIASFPGTALTMEDAYSSALVQVQTARATASGRYFTSAAEADASPADPAWAPQGGLSGLTVIQTPPGQTVKITLGSTLNSQDHPGTLIILGGGDVEFGGSGDYYGLIYCEGAFSTSHGIGDIHGVLISGSTVSLKGPAQLLYNELCVLPLHLIKTVAVRPVAGTGEWLDTTPPVTTEPGVDDGWHTGPVTLDLLAGDEFGGSGVDRSEYRLDSSDWTTGSSVTVSQDGVHAVSYRSVDRAGNVEEARSLTVRIDATPPTLSDSNDGLWHQHGYVVDLSATDALSGMTGGAASVEYSRDAGLTWQQGTAVAYRTWKRGGGSGLWELLWRATDAAGNTSAPASTVVRIDGRPPATTDDAPVTGQTVDTTVHLEARDALSGVAGTWYSLDGDDWIRGAAVTVAAGAEGLHTIGYYSVDLAGNVENPRWCAVTMAATGAGGMRPHLRLRR